MMPQDFDPDEFMSRRRKPAQPKTPTGDFDPDAFMAGRQKPERPQRLPAVINPEFSLTEGLGTPVRPQAKRPRPSAEEELIGIEKFKREKRQRDEAKAEADLIGPYDPAGYSEGTPLSLIHAEFNRKPFLERKFERAYDQLRAGGLDVSRSARQALGAVAGAVRAADLNPLTTFEMVDFPEWRRGDEERMRNLAERERARPPMSFGEEVGAGITRAVPTAGAAIGLGALTGGGTLGTAAIGGGLSAAGADWSNPRRAALETGVGALAPVIGGEIGRRAVAPIVSRLARPAAQRAARFVGEVGGGGIGNVGGALVMGERDPRELAKQFAVGSSLNVPGAVAAARRPAPMPESELPRVVALDAEMPVAAPESTPAVPGLPAGVRVIRAGEPFPPRERGQRQIPMDIEQPDGTTETVLVISPDRLNGRRVNETTLRPMAEQALKPAAQPVVATGAEPAPPRTQPPETKGRIVRVGDKDFTLTPEQEARWATEVDQAQADAKRYADEVRASDPQRAAGIIRGRMMEISAKKREIVGAFTPKEEAARAAREKTNYQGKAVSVDGVNGTIIRQVFGRVRVRLEDGRQIDVEPARIGAPVEPPRPQTARPAPEPEQADVGPRPEPTPARGVTPRATAELPRPAYPDAPETQEMPAMRERITAENAPTAELPQARPVSREFTNRITEGEGAELPRQPSRRLEGQPIELPPRRIQPPAPPQPAGRPQRPLQGQMYPDFPRDRRVMVGEGRRVGAEIEAGRGEKGEFGRIAQGMFKSASGQAPHGHDAFFHDPAVKGALGLSRDAEMGAVRAELKRELARSMGINADEVSLTQIGPRIWETWARQKRLPETARAKMRAAIGRYQEGAISDIEKTAAAQAAKPPERVRAMPATAAETGRKMQHSKFGEVTEAADQSGVRKGQLRVIGADGNVHIIRNPRVAGNREAAFVKSEEGAGPQIVQRMAKLAYSPTSPVEVAKLRAEFPEMSKEAFDAEMLKLAEEGRIALHRHDYVGSLSEAERAKLVKEGNNYFIAATFRERPGHVMGSGLGALQGLFERGGKAKAPAPEPQPGDLTRRERLGRKIGTLQTGAQLLNPKTIIQNVIGNAAFSGVKNAATFAALPVDKFLSAFTKQRQVATPELRTQFRDFVDGFTDIYHAVRSKDYAALADNRYELSNERVFKGKVGGFVEDVLNITLRGPDRGGFLAAYNDSVQQILKAHAQSKTKFSLDKIHEQAKMEAQQAVFQDSNKLSDFTVGLRNLINKFSPFGEKANFGPADFVGLKYPRTPANLVMRGIEYSPAGFAKAFYKAAKVMAGKGRGFDQREASLAFGKAFVGTLGGSGMGALLFAMGVITQPEQDDRGVQAAERGEGLMGYQLNLSALWRYATGGLLDALGGNFDAGKKQAGDVLQSYDWFQPWAFGLSMGAAAMRAAGKEKTDVGALDETLTQIDAVNSTLTDQSILRNINDAFKYGLKSTARKAVTDAPASFVPSVLNQARQIIDDRAREISKEKGISGVKREAFEKVLNKLPGASRRLPEKQDVVGRPVPSRMAGTAGAALVPVPGRFARYDPHPVLTEMQATGAGTTGIQRKPDETEEQFRARRAKAAGWRDQYGRTLTASPAYKSATPELRKAALDYLEEQISKQTGERRPSLHLFRPNHVLMTVRKSARDAERKKRREKELQ